MLRVLFLAFLLVGQVLSQCGPVGCYNGCTDARPKVDFVFMIDASGSMKPKIEGVVSGLTKFGQDLDSKKIDPKYNIVVFGGNKYRSNNDAALDEEMVGFSTFKTAMYDIINRVDGGVEAGLEVFRESLNTAASNKLNIDFRTGSNTQKVFILVTNEDSDPPINNANLWEVDSGRTNGFCDATGKSQGRSQSEVDKVASELIAAKARVYMFVPGAASNGTDVRWDQMCNTRFQYCDPDNQSQDAYFKNFDPQKTIQFAKDNGQNNLQVQLLQAGIKARCFEVGKTSNSQLIANFFDEIVTDISQCDKCYDYPCVNNACQTPVNKCDCAGVYNGNKVTTLDGKCCEADKVDCAGFCDQKEYDKCGVCVTKGTTYSKCVQDDCDNKWYLNMNANVLPLDSYKTEPYPDVAGYLLANPDLLQTYKTTWKSQTKVQEHYHQYGRFEGRPVCEFDASAYTGCTNCADKKADFLTRVITAPSTTARCVPGSTKNGNKIPRDSCNQCIIFKDAPPYCKQDCRPQWVTSASNLWLIDNCNTCVAPGTDLDAQKDFCKVCNGGNATMNQCGDCGGTKELDPCGQPKCKNLNCGTNCEGTPENPLTKKTDECGNCIPIALPRAATCVQDCAGQWYNKNAGDTNSPHIYDPCGICVLRATAVSPGCVKDCAGVYNGTHYYDACGQCVNKDGVGTYQCLTDCNGDKYLSNASPPHVVDSCGQCVLPANQDKLKDKCGICTNKPGYNSTAECTPDCDGNWLLITSDLRSFTDLCGKCWKYNQQDQRNKYRDSCGLCHNNCTEVDPTKCDKWNSLGNDVFDSQGKPCLCGKTAVKCPAPNEAVTTCTDECPVPPCADGKPKDDCGHCSDHPQYGKRDQCGLCCDPAKGLPCDVDLDFCGVCFGFNSTLNECGDCRYNNTVGCAGKCALGGICPGPCKTCIKDCLGVWGGSAVVDCEGKCNGNAVCSTCGDGKKDEGEECDLGPENNVQDSGCSPVCKVVGKNNNAVIIGSVIGAIAGVAFLALAAFFALKYAQSAGLIGSANKQVNMGASNTNPLYKSEVAVHQNPLYETS